ncbi:4-hydroxy-tetrahydrodipicolinate reductase [Shimazuella kribbensis]|uniref:4-hydroxy-tetrahydrodipicolinate reductase n=1 Tax=Shimazuella kribbensis TaxID=139808 RepID=UPI0004051F2C|nr:4-hydroxy-tetrahydrodipicolinate reductase [Shimazuella kribbensis]
MTIRIIVAGASGKMGQEVVKLIERTEHFQLVGAVSRTYADQEINGAKYYASLKEALEANQTDVVVDFTNPEMIRKHLQICCAFRVSPVVGTTGLTEEELNHLRMEFKQANLGGIIAPNFAVGAILMMRFAAQAAKYLPHVEIIESHHDRKLDAPSGTALKTAELITESRKQLKQGHPSEMEMWEGARGAEYHGFRIHSVRLPGLVAHQEVLFGGTGQLLTIRHDSLNRESFMPGVQLAVEKVLELNELIYGLENIMEV